MSATCPKRMRLLVLAVCLSVAGSGCGRGSPPTALIECRAEGGATSPTDCTDLPEPVPSMKHAPIAPLLVELGEGPGTAPGAPATWPGLVEEDGLAVEVLAESIDADSCGHVFDKPAPDPDLAAGPDHLIAAVNSSFQIFDKAGTVLHGPRSFDSFFGQLAGCADRLDGHGGAENLYDPSVLYDEEHDRFLIGNLHIAIEAGNPSIQGAAWCVAITATSDPLGAWYLYRFPMDLSAPGEIWMDFPRAGVGREALFMGGNLLTVATAQLEGRCPVEGRLWAFDRAAMAQGEAAAFSEHGLGAGQRSPRPLHLHGFAQGSWPTAGAHAFLTHDLRDGGEALGNLALFDWSDPFGTGVPSEVSALDMDALTGMPASPGYPPIAPQPALLAEEGPTYLAGNGTVPLDFEYRNGFGWTAQNVACDQGGEYPLSCIRWAQIHLETGEVVQHGVLPASASEGRVYPDLAVNDCNDMALVYTRSGATSLPAIIFTGRQGGDPLGAILPETILRESELVFRGAEVPCDLTGDPELPPEILFRWGDYFGATVDPDGTTFWILAEYSKDLGDTHLAGDPPTPIPVGGWGTVLASLALPSDGECAPACSDGRDDDGDGVTDFPMDPGCADVLDDSERSPELVCDDGLDNDGDGLVDHHEDPQQGDPGCRVPIWPMENPRCDDDLDNDGDGGVDWDGDPQGRGDGPAEADPECALEPWSTREHEVAGCARPE